MSETVSNGACVDVQAVRDSLPDGMVWDERETALLDVAARLARNVELLEADVEANGVRVDGKLNTALCELRQQQVALARVLGQVDVPDSVSARSLHGRKAAEARWGQG